MTDQNTASIVNTAIGALPAIIAMIRGLHAQSAPGAAPLTDDQVTAALAEAVASSIARDEAWLAAHPPKADVGPDVPGGGASD